MSTVLVSCAEASGDLLASGVLRALDGQGLRFVGIGGMHCRAAGMETTWDVSELSVMGIGEVLPKLWQILGILKGLERLAATERPSVALLVDAPDFNLRLAKRLKALGVRVVYYVSPSVWAWRAGRARTIARYVDEMCCILPFEEGWYRQRGVRARYVGHPLIEHEPPADRIGSLRSDLLSGGGEQLLALLPGSRRFEVRNLLPAMLGAARLLTKDRPKLEVAIPVAPTIDRSVIERYCDEAGFAAKLVDGRARELLGAADASIVASGTASLEAALAQTPAVVAYRASFLTELVFRLLVRAKHVALPNILAGKTVYPELLQRSVRPDSLAAEVAPLLDGGSKREEMLEGLRSIRAQLTGPGASLQVARAVTERLLPGASERALAGAES